MKRENEDNLHSQNTAPDDSTEPTGWVFGRHAILEALAAGRPVERIYLSDEAQGISVAELRKSAHGICDVDVVPRAALDRYAKGIHHQGVAARIAMVAPVPFTKWLAGVNKAEPMCVLLCDGIVDPGNLGAIIRSAVVLGAGAVLLGGKRAPLSPVVAKASAGCIFHIPIVVCDSETVAITDLKNAGFWVYATAEEATASLLDVALHERLVWVIGSEERGVSSSVRKVVDEIVAIPNAGKMPSLNASVAAAVVLFATMSARLEVGDL